MVSKREIVGRMHYEAVKRICELIEQIPDDVWRQYFKVTIMGDSLAFLKGLNASTKWSNEDYLQRQGWKSFTILMLEEKLAKEEDQIRHLEYILKTGKYIDGNTWDKIKDTVQVNASL